MIPYAKHSITAEDIDAVVRVLRGEYLTTGPAVDEFETALARAIGAAGAVSCSSGTAALHMAYLGLKTRRRTEILMSPLTFAATANMAVDCGLKPVFIDVDPYTLNIHPELVRAAISEKTAAIVAVHYGGRPCELEVLRAIADEADVPLVEDACHALGAWYMSKPVGSAWGHCAVWSFHPAKHVAAGEGGAVTSPTGGEVLDLWRQRRNHGIDLPTGKRTDWAYDVEWLGYNYRMSDINAALASSQLRRLSWNVGRRRTIAQLYNDFLKNVPGVVLPAKDDRNHESAWHLYPIRVPNRADVYHRLKAVGIGVNVHYRPVYLHTLYRNFGYKQGLCPEAEKAYADLISLPMFPELGDGTVEMISEEVKRAVATA